MKFFLVGGAVRDEMLGVPVGERDWVVIGGSEAEMLAQGFRRADTDFPVFHHPETGEEYTLARRERKTGPGYRGFSIDSGKDVTLEEDLLRRDLTINAMARDADGELIDLFDGRADITRRQLRHVSAAFVEDPLRLLRLARFAAQLGAFEFEVATETLPLLQRISDSGELARITPSRRWLALQRALAFPHMARFLEVLSDCGALQQLYPVLAEGLAVNEELPQVLNRLSNVDAPTRYAVLYTAVGNVLGSMVDDELPAPRRFKQRLEWLRLGLGCLETTPSPAALVDLFGRLGAYQQPVRWQDMLAGVAALRPGLVDPERMQRSLEAARGVDPATLLTEGLRGDALGAALHDRRVAAVAEVLAS